MRFQLCALVVCCNATLAFGQPVLPTPQTKTPVDEQAIQLAIHSLIHPDKAIREAAEIELLSDEVNCDAALVEDILDTTVTDKEATAAAVVLIKRFKNHRRNIEDLTQPLFELTDEDHSTLSPLVEALSHDLTDARWYLAASVLDELQPAALLQSVPVLVAQLSHRSGMRQYAAVRALRHLSSQASADVKASLFDLLQRGPSRFRGIYLRSERVLEENLLALTNDIRTYHDVRLDGDGYRSYEYFANEELLICDVLAEMHASFDDLAPTLIPLSLQSDASTRMHAARLLVKLGSHGQHAAAVAVADLLLHNNQMLTRLLADEHPYIVGEVKEVDSTSAQHSRELFLDLGASQKLVVAPLTGLLRNGDADVREVATVLLAKIGKSDRAVALAALKAAAKQESLLNNACYASMQEAIRQLEGVDN